MRAAITSVLVLTAATVGLAVEAESYRLEEVKYIENFVGSEQARALLARQGLVVTDQQFKQIFEAYIGGGTPSFITVDSAWHTYHVLLEEGLRTLEERKAAVLQRFSEKLYQAAKEAERRADSVYADLARFAGVGWALQDRTALERLGGEEKVAVADVIRRLDSEQDWMKVLFFGLPVSPQRLHASSFYSDNAALRGYFAARQWYATCDFRLSSETETARALHLTTLIESDGELKSLHSRLTETYDLLLGPPDDAGVRQYAAAARELSPRGELTPETIPTWLGAFRREAAKLPDPKVNDQLLLPEDYVRFAGQIKGFRLLPPRQLPSAILFQNTVHPLVEGRMFPSGVDLFAAGPLACDAGRRALRASVKDTKIIKSIENSHVDPLPDSLHGRVLELFRLLQDPLPKNAPAPLRSAAWHDKQLWTALGAWAEQRHTWALHTKLTMHYLGMAMQPPGYVSPYPEFYRRLARLSRDTSEVLEAEGDIALDPKGAAKELLACVDVIRRRDSNDAQWTEETYNRVALLAEFLQQYEDKRSFETEEDVARCCDELEKLASRWAAGEPPQERDRRLIAMLTRPEGNAKDLLQEFADLCDRLAAIADKQLEDKPLSKEDVERIKGYGQALAKFHFYGGNAYLTPRDDFPLTTPLFTSPVHAETLHAGIGRPEAVWVITNFQGRPVLHRGAVLSYREFRRPIALPLDDESWTTEVRTGKTPPPPAFTRSFRVATTVDEVVRMIRTGKIYPAIDTMPDREITQAIVETLVKREPHSNHSEPWLRACLCARADDEDVGSLLEVLQKTPVDHAGEIADCIARLNWLPHRATMMDLLRHDTPQYADSAAYLLSQRPDDIDRSALASTYDGQKPRTRRLYCYVLGHSKQSDEAVTELLLKMLEDKEATVRYQAALAVTHRGVREQRIDHRLIAGLDDPNPYTGAAMAQTLVALKVAESAPYMLARLKRLVAAGSHPPGSDSREEDAFTRGSDYSGLDSIRVLSERTWNQSSLASELIEGLGVFRCTAAQEQLRSMLSGSYGADALQALIRIDPKGNLDLATQVALDCEAEYGTRRYAFEVIASTGNPDRAAPLLSLLDAPPTQGDPLSRWTCSDAAETVGKLLAKGASADSKYDTIRQEAIARLRKLLRTESGTQAMNALIRIDPLSKAGLLLSMALDKKAHGDVRFAALERLPHDPFADDGGEMVDPNKVTMLLPLFDDTSSAVPWGDTRICEQAAQTAAELVLLGVNDATKRAVTASLRKMLQGEYGLAALDALEKIDWQRRADLLIEAALDRRLRGKTRARAIEQVGWIDIQKTARCLVPLLDDESQAKEGLRICDVAAETILSAAASSWESELEAHDTARNRLPTEMAQVADETDLETRARKIEAARQRATNASEN